MAEVRDDLVPTDGLTNSMIRLAGLDVLKGGAAMMKFEIADEKGGLVGTFTIPVGPMPEGTVDAMIIEGYRQMKDVTRQWLHDLDLHHQSFLQRSAS